MKEIILCGVGALGSWLLCLARGLDASWILVDHDRVEKRNLLGQAFVPAVVGRYKVEAARLVAIRDWGYPQALLGTLPVRIVRENALTVLRKADAIVDCLDNVSSRVVVQDAADEQRIPVLHAGIDAGGMHGRIRWGRAFPLEPGDPGQAAETCLSADNLPHHAIVAGALARVLGAFLTEGRTFGADVDGLGMRLVR